MSSYWTEFLAIVVAHGLAVSSPGPDFAIVLRQSLHHGRRTALWTSCGIGCGLAVHITYCLLGLGLLLKNSAIALLTVKWLGAAYLAWVGVQALRSRPRGGDFNHRPAGRCGGTSSRESSVAAAGLAGARPSRTELGEDGDRHDFADHTPVPTARAAWSAGFLVNVLNPKVALFFIALFPVVVSATTPKWIQAGYGAWMVASTIGWFSFVSVVFAKESVRRAFLRHGHWIDRALGVVFLGFAVSLAVTTLR